MKLKEMYLSLKECLYRYWNDVLQTYILKNYAVLLKSTVLTLLLQFVCLFFSFFNCTLMYRANHNVYNAERVST